MDSAEYLKLSKGAIGDDELVEGEVSKDAPRSQVEVSAEWVENYIRNSIGINPDELLPQDALARVHRAGQWLYFYTRTMWHAKGGVIEARRSCSDNDHHLVRTSDQTFVNPLTGERWSCARLQELTSEVLEKVRSSKTTFERVLDAVKKHRPSEPKKADDFDRLLRELKQYYEDTSGLMRPGVARC